ncbi:unnamed protein product [Ceratitis capitata]|uniref:(Mediterranean fruit fly) hypothetical protein n=1 Tax=Ceratitis capitata TaxID=7213 RepID=A0A811UGC5_CERCA|nr:unnamed protein product [Ceratitis capitata]
MCLVSADINTNSSTARSSHVRPNSGGSGRFHLTLMPVTHRQQEQLSVGRRSQGSDAINRHHRVEHHHFARTHWVPPQIRDFVLSGLYEPRHHTGPPNHRTTEPPGGRAVVDGDVLLMMLAAKQRTYPLAYFPVAFALLEAFHALCYLIRKHNQLNNSSRPAHKH